MSIRSQPARQRLVDGIVADLEHHVMQARAIVGIADVHARALAHGIQALQHLDAVGAIFIFVLLRGVFVFSSVMLSI